MRTQVSSQSQYTAAMQILTGHASSGGGPDLEVPGT